MKKIVCMIFMLVCFLFVCSCDLNNNNSNQDSSLDGIDISKYEMPQTEFLHDGHSLTKLESVMKLVIDEGTFVYDKHLNSIGYKKVFEESGDSSLFAFYHLNELKIMHVEVVGKTAYMSYFKLIDDEEMFSICHKIQYYSARRQDFFAIMNCEKALFGENYLGEYELYRGYNTSSEEVVTEKLVFQCTNLLDLLNNYIDAKMDINLSEFGFNY